MFGAKDMSLRPLFAGRNSAASSQKDRRLQERGHKQGKRIHLKEEMDPRSFLIRKRVWEGFSLECRDFYLPNPSRSPTEVMGGEP